MTRVRLPNRRHSEIVPIDHGGQEFVLSVGYFDDGRAGEVFARGAKSGSTMDSILADSAVAISLLLQHGATAAEIHRSMAQLPEGGPASVIGAITAMLVEIG